jgi:hypothetical protein
MSISWRQRSNAQTQAALQRGSMRTEGGAYGRDHLRVLVQRVDLNAAEVRTMGSKLARPKRGDVQQQKTLYLQDNSVCRCGE